jgi:hypothetical protein
LSESNGAWRRITMLAYANPSDKALLLGTRFYSYVSQIS